MRHFQKVADHIETGELSQQLAEQPGLWDRHTARTAIPRGPFAGTSDIWIRTRAIEELTEPKRHTEPHWPVFYPAWHALPALHGVVIDLLSRLEVTHLGAILITRIPAGGSVKPHHDRGSWHAEFHPTKVYIPLRTNPECVNYCGGERVVMKPGEAWAFNNLVEHSVVNDGEADRITLIVCARTIDDETKGAV